MTKTSKNTRAAAAAAAAAAEAATTATTALKKGPRAEVDSSEDSEDSGAEAPVTTLKKRRPRATTALKKVPRAGVDSSEDSEDSGVEAPVAAGGPFPSAPFSASAAKNSAHPGPVSASPPGPAAPPARATSVQAPVNAILTLKKRPRAEVDSSEDSAIEQQDNLVGSPQVLCFDILICIEEAFLFVQFIHAAAAVAQDEDRPPYLARSPVQLLSSPNEALVPEEGAGTPKQQPQQQTLWSPGQLMSPNTAIAIEEAIAMEQQDNMVGSPQVLCFDILICIEEAFLFCPVYSGSGSSRSGRRPVPLFSMVTCPATVVAKRGSSAECQESAQKYGRV